MKTIIRKPVHQEYDALYHIALQTPEFKVSAKNIFMDKRLD